MLAKLVEFLPYYWHLQFEIYDIMYIVEVHYYSKKDNITNLKGQIKIDQNGAKKAIFTTKVDKKFIVLIIDNQFLVSTIINQCNKAYKKVNF